VPADVRRNVERFAAEADANEGNAFTHTRETDFLFLIRDDHPPGALVA
jgi:hypothetical protein